MHLEKLESLREVTWLVADISLIGDTGDTVASASL